MRFLLRWILPVILLLAVQACAAPTPERNPFADKPTSELIVALQQMEQDADPRYWQLIDEFTARGTSASEAAPALAKAITYKRRDSAIAGGALLAMGPAAADALPQLLINLDSDRPDVRRYSVLAIGTIGRPCAVPAAAVLLWDPDPAVRSSAAAAIQAITGQQLVDPLYEIDPALPGVVPLDEPAGALSGPARTWWLKSGIHGYGVTQFCGG